MLFHIRQVHNHLYNRCVAGAALGGWTRDTPLLHENQLFHMNILYGLHLYLGWSDLKRQTDAILVLKGELRDMFSLVVIWVMLHFVA